MNVYRWTRALVAVAVVLSPALGYSQSAQPPMAAAEAVAVVNGVAITEAELQAAGALGLDRIARQYYSARSDTLERLIANRLLDAEASRRGMTRSQYEQVEVDAKVKPVNESDIDEVVAANRARIDGDEAKARSSIRTYLEHVRRTARRSLIVTNLKSAASVQLLVSDPPPYRVQFDLQGAPIRGNASAPVTIVEFSDFHCPFCRRVQPTLSELLAKYGERVRVVYKHFPLDGPHPAARKVSEAAWCAGQQGRFWQFHDAVYAHTSSDASDANLVEFAKKAQLDLPSWEDCRSKPEAAKAVQRDSAAGEALGVASTPAFFVNGRELLGAAPIQMFETLIEEELRSSMSGERLSVVGTPPGQQYE